MRQRKIKDIEEKLVGYHDLIVEAPVDCKGRWREVICEMATAATALPANAATTANANAPLFVEIGCGKGRFITTLAKENPENLYVAIEGFSSVIYRALQKAKEAELRNVGFIKDFVFDLGNWFGDEELDGIYLNFSDPWPKKKNAKRRLTYRDRLEQYAKALKPGGFLRIKTDNDDFFEFTLEELELIKSRAGLEVEYETRDLHNSPWKDSSPMTEYEAKFSGSGKNINFLALRKI